MEAHRINGIKTHVERLSDEELENSMGYAHERIERASHDLETLGIESARRFATAESVGESTLGQLIEFPGQQELPGLDGTPPAAA